MNSNDLLNDFVNSIANRIALDVEQKLSAKIEVMINKAVDDRLSNHTAILSHDTVAYEVKKVFDNANWRHIVNDNINIDDIADGIDIEDIVKDVLNNASFSVSVDY